MIRYACGCANEVHEPTGALRSLAKCAAHQAMRRDPAGLDLQYYEENGAIIDGIPQCRRYAEEMEEALGAFPAPTRSPAFALEVGCGASMYAPSLLKAGYGYLGVDPSPWADAWTASAFVVGTTLGTIEDAELPPGLCDLVVAAHVLEHVADAPYALGKIAAAMRRGGRLYLIVPDDSDPVNPDHLWTFDERSLTRCVEGAGLEVEWMTVRSRIEREAFIYCRARKS